MNTPTTARELDTQLGRIELENAAYKMTALADKARQSSPKLAQIADELAAEILQKIQLMQHEIDANIAAEADLYQY